MMDGFVLGPGEGLRVSPAMTLKVGDKNSQAWSMFEVAGIGPGFDVGAHLHRNAEELFYVLDGQLDLLAFEPRVRTAGNWQSWQSHTGATVARGGPGSMMYVPRGCPHAFANPGPGSTHDEAEPEALTAAAQQLAAAQSVLDLGPCSRLRTPQSRPQSVSDG